MLESSLPGPSDQQYVAICLAAAEEQLDIVEWAKYHQRVGVGKIYVIDTGHSMGPVLEEAGLIQSGFVEHTLITNTTALREDLIVTTNHSISVQYKQLMAYSLCLRDHRHKHQWIAFIDTDEYITVTDPSGTLQSILADYVGYGGVGVNWRMYGSGGAVERPAVPVQEAYHTCYPMPEPEHQHIKSIANTAHVRRSEGAHHVSYTGGYYAVNTAFERVYGPKTPAPTYGRLVLRHYVSKSLQDYAHKVARGSGMSRKKNLPYFFHVQRLDLLQKGQSLRG